MTTDQDRIRNFSIIAHIDHGKSTLADRILEETGALSDREKTDQFLDKMELERERGITIKAQSVRLSYKAEDGKTYQLNLIDTPGHVDFNYEVSRSLSACEGALLVVDASQGVEAQTVANVYLAIGNDLEIIPVFNKIDLPSADVERAQREVEDVIGLDCEGAIAASAKTGQGIHAILESVVARVPPPKGQTEGPLRALIIDSWYDSYRGAVVLVRVVDGHLRKGEKVRMLATGADYEVTEVGVFAPYPVQLKGLGPGEVGFFSAAIKSVKDTKVGDTVTNTKNPTDTRLPGFEEVKPMVFAGIFPTDPDRYGDLRDALSRLNLNDAAFHFEPDNSDALGLGFRCGFLGLLHMEVVQERLEREYNLDLVTTAPSVVYRVHDTKGEVFNIENPSKLPDPAMIQMIEEPYFQVAVHCPEAYVGAVLKLCEERRGVQKGIQYASKDRVIITYELPLAEVLFDFYDRLKSGTRGYASMDYELIGYRPNKLIRLDLLINGEPVDALSAIVHRDRAHQLGRQLAEKLKQIVPRQQFDVAIQAAIGARVIARETVKAMRKDVTAKCYGGDISRKRKLLEKQKEGKKRMKNVGAVEIPQEAFHAILKVD
ncbi:MAG: translation elongation factor 4 [Myxococcales bacterium]|nr:translation elongation factor 4 [Myxococcales bacterium]